VRRQQQNQYNSRDSLKKIDTLFQPEGWVTERSALNLSVNDSAIGMYQEATLETV